MCRDHSQTTSRRRLEAWYPWLETRLEPSLLASDPPLQPDQHGQYPCPALGYLTCSGIFTVSIRDSEQGYAGLSQGPAAGDVADSAVGLSPH